MLPCPLSHCSRLDRQFSDQLQRAVWSESRLRVPPTSYAVAGRHSIWHLASGIWHLLPATPLSTENMWRIVARRRRYMLVAGQ